MKYEIRYLTDENGCCQVLGFVKAQGINFEAKYFAYIDQLIAKGPTLPRPLADYLKDGIHELRLKYRGQVRILYFFVHQKYIVMSHAFIKKGSAVLEIEIIKAKRNRDRYLKLAEAEKAEGN